MKNQPTYDDANLILRLYELRREEALRAARKWFGSVPPFTSREEWLKTCPPGSEENAWFRMVTSYWDMAASFVANGILNRELFYQSNNNEMLFVWARVKNIVVEMREAQKNPLYWKNLEEVVIGFIAWLDDQAPGFFDTISANLAKMAQKK